MGKFECKYCEETCDTPHDGVCCLCMNHLDEFRLLPVVEVCEECSDRNRCSYCSNDICECLCINEDEGWTDLQCCRHFAIQARYKPPYCSGCMEFKRIQKQFKRIQKQ